MTSPVFKIVKPSTEAERTTRTVADTIEITPNLAKSWRLPPFQRPLKVNAKVIALSQEIHKNGGVIPGYLTIGVLEQVQYLIDGQHRREAFLLSECLTGYVDIRIAHFRNMAEMAEEFKDLNSRLVQMKPDDFLRAMESGSPPLTKLRKRCPYIGYDQIRRADKSPLLSMSSVLRCWNSSSKEVPQSGGTATTDLAMTLLMDDVDQLIKFLELAFHAWGRDSEYVRLWGSLNLTLTMWLYRRMVVTVYSAKTQKLTPEIFEKCLMMLAADQSYIDWLVGQQLSDRSRSPGFNRIKALFAKRLEIETGKKPLLPQPSWAGGRR